MVGKTLGGRYELLEKIGEGGMARVYRGRDLLLKRTVAVKVLKDQMTGDAEFIRRFRREAQAVAGLSHPHIVNVFDVGEEEDIYYIVMEFVGGKNLKQHIRDNERLPAQEAAAVTRQIAEALVEAHAAGVIHRDIKPQNILFSRDGQVKVADFGIAIAADGSTLTCSDDIVGSVHYFSPEQARGGLAGNQSDLYSLGVILYEMVTGQVPFSGENPVSVAMKHVQDQVPPPRSFTGDIPEPLERIILKAMQKDSTRRYQNAESFLEDLLLFQQKGAARAMPDVNLVDDSDEDTIVMKPLKGPPAGDEEPVAAAAGRKSWLIPLVAIIFLSSALLVGFIAFRGLIFVPEVTVPALRGMPQNDAVEILRQEGLQPNQKVEYVYDDNIAKGHVVRTDPLQGRVVRKNRVVDLYISMGPENILIPDLYMKTEMEARILLDERELKVDVVREHHEEVPEGRVFRQVPREGFQLAQGEEVTIFVSLGGSPFAIANLVGQTREQAEAYMQQEGLKPRLRYERSDQPGGTVLAQFPEAGRTVRRGQSVDLVISQGAD